MLGVDEPPEHVLDLVGRLKHRQEGEGFRRLERQHERAAG
jgi:hypothetical protein